MGACSGQSRNKGLSPNLRRKAELIFDKIDVNGSGSIDRQETLKYWY
jgi:EF hand